VLYFKQKQYEEASAAFLEAIRLEPGDASARYNLGVTSLVRRERERALEQYQALKRLNGELATRLYGGIYQGLLLIVSDK